MKIKLPSLPFLTREMLKWGNTASLKLRVTVGACSANPVALKGLTRSGTLDLEFTPGATGEVTQKYLAIDDMPIWISVVDLGRSFAQGECWASVELYVNGDKTITLCSGQVYRDHGITFPAVSAQDIVPGRGCIANVNSSNPAAGAECSIEVPVGQIWRVLSGNASLVTSAAVANRRPHFVFTGPNGNVIDTFNDTEITNNETANFRVAQFGTLPARANDSDHLVPMPAEIWLGGEGTIATKTTAIEADDDWGIMRFMVEKFPAQS